MIVALLGALTLTPGPQAAPDLAALTRATLEQCVAAPETVSAAMVEVSDADWARPFGGGRECGVTADGWRGDDGALTAGARAAVDAEGPEWTGPVRESRPNERGPALWTRLERTENGRESWLMIIEPPAGQRGPVEVYYGREG
jgi:hypothetical protein